MKNSLTRSPNIGPDNMNHKQKTLCRVGIVIIAILTAPIWLPFYLFEVAMLWREDEHD
jgi:hypothetical protein